MTTFAHPESPDSVVHWEQLASDEEKQLIVDAFRSRYSELQARQGVAFKAEEEDAKIPLVVRQWEEQVVKAREAKPAQLFNHPLGHVPLDWNTLSEATRVVIARMYEEQEEVPAFIQEWRQSREALLRERRDRDLAAFDGVPGWTDDQPLLHHRRFLLDHSKASLHESQVATRMLHKMLGKPAEPLYLRRQLYESQLSNSQAFREAKVQFTLLVNKESLITSETRRLEAESRARLKMEHHEQLRAHDNEWGAQIDKMQSLFDHGLGEKAKRAFEEAARERERLMKLVIEMRTAGTLPNLGVTSMEGALLDRARPGPTELSDEQVQCIRKEVFPLLAAAMKKRPTVRNYVENTEQNQAGIFLELHRTEEAVRHISVRDLNVVLDRYDIVKPKKYLETIAWMGSALDNFQEVLVAMRQAEKQELQQSAARSQMQQVVEDAMRKKAQSQSQTATTASSNGETTTSSS